MDISAHLKQGTGIHKHRPIHSVETTEIYCLVLYSTWQTDTTKKHIV